MTNYLRMFFPKTLKWLQSPKWKGVLGHLMAVHQHIGFKTIHVDFTYDPLIAAWFACHRQTPQGFKLVDQSFTPVVFCIQLKNTFKRVYNLHILPDIFLRPKRQKGATISTAFFENLRDYIDKTVKLIPPKNEKIFRELSESYLFPNLDDPLHDYYQYVSQWGHDFPWIVNWLTKNSDSALHRLYNDQREKFIIQLCKHYDAYWVHRQDGLRLLTDYRKFDEIKLSGGDVDIYKWRVRSGYPFFSEADWGNHARAL